MKTGATSNTLFFLIRSLSKAEKRYFRLYTKLQGGDKTYVSLFDLYEKASSPEQIHAHFKTNHPQKSFEMAAKQLYKVILICLVKLRDKEDIQTTIFNHITKAAILFERELRKEAFAELTKAKHLATKFENDTLLLLIRRTELKYMSTINFEGISERELVQKQIKLQETMRHTRSVNQHLQLYDILKHRITYKGYARSDKQKNSLNDLVLSELNLTANSSYDGFESQKLHLLFQATYYLHTGHYKSAIRYYQELITLFETNQHLILNPPIYYMSAIEGILDSLHTVGLYSEMPFFLSKIKELEKKPYTAEFILHIRALICFYELTALLHTGQLSEAGKLLEKHKETFFHKTTILNPDIQLKLYLQEAYYFLLQDNIFQARKSMKKIGGSGKLFQSLPSFRTARLINLLIQAEAGNYDFMENEINSIKRSIRHEKQVYQTEKLVFRFVSLYPLPVYEKTRLRLWKNFQTDFLAISQNKYEHQLLKTFPFFAWIESKLTRRPFAEILHNTK